jgi:beta-galactosidase
VQYGVNRFGKQLRYYFNYSGELVSFVYSGVGGNNLLTDEIVLPAERLTLKPWDLVIVEGP